MYTELINRLKANGVYFTEGLTHRQIEEIEAFFGFRFPREIKEFFMQAYPMGGRFFRYKDMSEENLKYFNDFQKDIEECFRFDIEMNEKSIFAQLEDIIPLDADKETAESIIFENLRQSPRLIPFYGHRCFFDGIDNMPIVSFSQPVDTIFYGADLQDYLEHEFLGKEKDLSCDEIYEKMKSTGIWYHIVE